MLHSSENYMNFCKTDLRPTRKSQGPSLDQQQNLPETIA
jgi:hypothetical protein